MNEDWLSQTLCEIEGVVRIERGPQVMEMTCDDDSLRDEVTAPRYKPGKRDADGRLIMPDEAAAEARARGDKAAAAKIMAAKRVDESIGRAPIQRGEPMRIIDDRAKHVPFMWKVYALTHEQEVDKDGRIVPVERFRKIAEIEGKADALDQARGYVEATKAKLAADRAETAALIEEMDA